MALLNGCSPAVFVPAAPCRRRPAVAAKRIQTRGFTSPAAAVRCSAAYPPPAAAAAAEKDLGERLRRGGLVEDGFSYKECFIVRCYEAGANKTATLETVVNLFKEVGCNHVHSLGFSRDELGTTTAMRKLHTIMVTSRIHLEMYKYPSWGDVIEIETWCQEDGRNGIRRDWIVKDLANGLVIGRATSKWVMMNQDTRKLQRVSDEVREECSTFGSRTPRLAFPEDNNSSLKKIPKLQESAQHLLLGLTPRRADLDSNQHVSYVTYFGWVMESMPQEIINTHELQTITLEYRRECHLNDMVDILTNTELAHDVAEENMRRDQCQFLHFVRMSGTGHEINRGRTVWRKLVR